MLAIPNSKARVKLARRMARSGQSIDAVVKASERLGEALVQDAAFKNRIPTLRTGRRDGIHEATSGSVPRSPMIDFAVSLVGNRIEPKFEEMADDTPMAWMIAREQAYLMCDNCSLRPNSPEPAWQLFLASTRNGSAGFGSVSSKLDLCQQCPGVDFFRKLAEACDRIQS